MCLQTIQVIPLGNRRHWVPYRQRNPSNLIYPQISASFEQAVKGALWNCQSSVRKADFISAYAASLSLNFLALTETWISPQNTATPAALSDGFSFSHSPRGGGKQGGGAGLLITREWNYTPLTILDTSASTFEFLAVSISHPVNLTIVVIYRPPHQLGNFLEEIEALLSNLPDNGFPLIVLGDFNLPTAKERDPFVALLADFHLDLTPGQATHKKGNELDLVFTRNAKIPNMVATPLHVSDHYFLSFTAFFLSHLPLADLPEPEMVTTRPNLRSLSETDFSTMVLQALPNPEAFSLLSPEEATDSLFSSISTSLNELCPLTSRPARRRPPSPWLTDQVRASRRSLRAAERKWNKTRLQTDLSNFQTLLGTFSSNVSTAKQDFYHSRITSSASNPRKLFGTFKSLLHPPEQAPDSSLLPEDFANFFDKKVNDIRSSFGPPHSNPSPPSTSQPLSHTPPSTPHLPFPPIPSPLDHPSPSHPTFHTFSPLSHDAVLQLITSSRPATCALDPAPSPLIQATAQVLLPYYTHQINSSLMSGCFPASLKSGRVTPLLKKPSLDPTDVKNYRPVSQIPFLGKSIERAMAEQLKSFFHQNNILDDYQSGFKSGHSTETALLAVTESLRCAKALSLSSVLISLDLSAAFDTVNHQILLAILEEVGITGSALALMASYLSDRSYHVSWRGRLSEPRCVTTGVPQGSVLGPLLFSVYTTSLGSVIRSHGFSYHCYADDTQLFLSFPPTDTQVESRIANCLADISKWMAAHHLKLNLDKTELLFIPGKRCPHRDLSITIENTVVTTTPTVRILGVTLDDQLSFSDHIAATARSCRFQLYNIRKIRPFLTEKATQLLIQATVISRLDYCNSLLAGVHACVIKPLELIQKAAARLVFKHSKFSHSTPLLRKLHWLPVSDRIKFKTLTLAYRAVNGTAPPYLQALVKPHTPPRQLRSSSAGLLSAPSLQGPDGRLKRSQLFSVVAPTWWNDLKDKAITTAETLSTFRRRLKTHLFQ